MINEPENTKDAAEKPNSSLSPMYVYIQMMRPWQWSKNLLVLVGVALAYFDTASSNLPSARLLLLGLASTCIIASSNYVINEILDAPSDCRHEVKRHRPAAEGRVSISLAYSQWFGLAVLGILIASLINFWFCMASISLLISGLVYNVQPVRLKDLPYLDVLAEGFNSPIRMLLGWFLVTTDSLPSACHILLFWAAGAFLMTWKRRLEYGSFRDKATAAAYRNSFRHYNEYRLSTTMLAYAFVTTVILVVIFT